MIASVATAVKIEITGAMAIIHGTAVSGDEDSFESSLNTSASGCMRPLGPTRLGPIRDWKRPSSLRSSSRMSGTIWRMKAKITIDFTIITSVLSIRRPPLRAEARLGRLRTDARRATSTGPSGSTPGGVRNTLPGGTPVRTRAVACARSPPRSARPGRPTRRRGARASSGASSTCGLGARKLSERECSTSRPAQSVGAVVRVSSSGPAAASPSGVAGSSSSGQRARRLAVLPAHASAADLVERQPP